LNKESGLGGYTKGVLRIKDGNEDKEINDSIQNETGIDFKIIKLRNEVNSTKEIKKEIK
jgi:hypothetical protein